MHSLHFPHPIPIILDLILYLYSIHSITLTFHNPKYHSIFTYVHPISISYIPYSFHNPKYFSSKKKGLKRMQKVEPTKTKQTLVLWKQF